MCVCGQKFGPHQVCEIWEKVWFVTFRTLAFEAKKTKIDKCNALFLLMRTVSKPSLLIFDPLGCSMQAGDSFYNRGSWKFRRWFCLTSISGW